MKELVELIAKALVDSPEKVQVSQLEGEQTTILERCLKLADIRDQLLETTKFDGPLQVP